MTWGDMKMLRHTRTSRFVATLAVGVVAGLPLLVAEPATAASRQVQFSSSQAGLLSCDSTPSDRDLAVAAESTVTFVNRLGDDATLRINGRDSARVQEDSSTEVLFHRGTVRVEMVPDCGLSLSNDIEAVSVTVVAADDPEASPSSRGPARSGNSPPAGASVRSSRPSHTAGGDRSGSPGGGASASSGGGPAAGGATSPEAGAGNGQAAGGDEGVAAEPVSTDEAAGKKRPNGLLVIIAVICVVGVSIGAIRAIAAQRATRTSVA